MHYQITFKLLKMETYDKVRLYPDARNIEVQNYNKITNIHFQCELTESSHKKLYTEEGIKYISRPRVNEDLICQNGIFRIVSKYVDRYPHVLILVKHTLDDFDFDPDKHGLTIFSNMLLREQ